MRFIGLLGYCCIGLPILHTVCNDAALFKMQNQDDIWDWEIYIENKNWDPVIVSGPSILVASNETTIFDQSGQAVNAQLSNNNVGIGMLNMLIDTYALDL